MRVWIAVWTGSTQITARLAAWLARRPLLRTAAVFGIALFLKGLPWTWRIAWAAGGAWLITAIVLGLRLPDPTKPAEAPAPGGDGQAGEEPGTPAAAPDWTTRENLARALHTVGAPHAHISALAEHLDASTEAVREALAEAGIPTEGGVRMKGRKVAVSTGVKRSDFPPLPSPAPDDAVAPVLTSNNNDNNGPVGGDREGIRVERTDGGVVIYDLADGHRHTATAKRPS
ncbi:hypothetical protein [Streptomyces antibioticus]|uniref:hypothetical protein n=1 Tax=Streptomyces antibioticus TaxID=1890 RepID=UPI0037003A8C